MVDNEKEEIGDASLVQQNYIEVIADLMRRNGWARTCDIAEKLDVSLPSVSEVVRRLVFAGFVCRKSRHEIVLAPKGQAIFDQLDRRQKALHHFMTDILGFDDDKAEEMACELEHCVDARFVESLLVLDSFMDVKGNEKVKQAWENFRLLRSQQGKRTAK